MLNQSVTDCKCLETKLPGNYSNGNSENRIRGLRATNRVIVDRKAENPKPKIRVMI
ncbi:hypothetical protein BSP18_050 [Bacillus phage BSP18]|nr:hypothetical protein BSP18_050 [Bacillus phage BSP18]